MSEYMAAGFQGEIVIGEIQQGDPTKFEVVRLSKAIRMREVPTPSPTIGGIKMKIDHPVVEFVPSDAKSVEEVIKPAYLNLKNALWATLMSGEEFEKFVKSIGGPTNIVSAQRVPS